MGSDSEESYDPGEPPAATTEAPAMKDEEMYDLGVFDEDPEELQKRAVALMKQRDLRTSLKSREAKIAAELKNLKPPSPAASPRRRKRPSKWDTTTTDDDAKGA